jgi:hypothetical protein
LRTTENLLANATNRPDGQITSDFPKSRQPRESKIFRLTRRANQRYQFAPSHPTRGALRTSRSARWDAVDADVPLTNGTEVDGEDVWSWRPKAGAKFAGNFSLMTVATEHGSPGRARYKP